MLSGFWPLLNMAGFQGAPRGGLVHAGAPVAIQVAFSLACQVGYLDSHSLLDMYHRERHCALTQRAPGKAGRFPPLYEEGGLALDAQDCRGVRTDPSEKTPARILDVRG